jgi:hypothetical protein
MMCIEFPGCYPYTKSVIRSIAGATYALTFDRAVALCCSGFRQTRFYEKDVKD